MLHRAHYIEQKRTWLIEDTVQLIHYQFNANQTLIMLVKDTTNYPTLPSARLKCSSKAELALLLDFRCVWQG